DVNDWWDNPATWRVLYYDGAILPDEEAILPEMIDDEIFRSFAMVFYPRMMLPDPADLLKESKWAHYERELYVELYDRFLYMQKWFFDDPQNVVPCHWFRGYCQSLQNPMTPSGKNLLLQLDSDDKVFYWVNGSGRLYYFISDEDLRRRDFSNVHFEIES
ncbi:MAG TPA: DUF1963 domain-containing protein, partial [Oceanobacillus sp.]|nr:DUF1963 domain-containing protein [Oceanobacillus sp.]